MKTLAVKNEVTTLELLGMSLLICIIFMTDFLSLVIQNIILNSGARFGSLCLGWD